jgi:hypothetical protein
LGILPFGVGGEEPMPLDLNRLFPIKDVPSARLMKLKAHCLFRAGVLSEEQRAMIEHQADAIIHRQPQPTATVGRHAA